MLSNHRPIIFSSRLSCRGFVPTSHRFVAQEPGDIFAKQAGLICQQDVMTMVYVEALRAQMSRHGSLTHGHALIDLDPGSTAHAKRNHHNGSLTEMFDD